MALPNLFILYVKNTETSRRFYENLLERPPQAAFPNYVAFDLQNSMILGLWSTQAENFVSGGEGHKGEVAFMVQDETAVNAAYARWSELGVTIEQEPHCAVFGPTFVGVDPDGHRLRVCTPDT
ncbi:VOC family protein [Flexibacterium corallicola]|uniref:VOC family protein n=1 Tax=Flexibacterium corallicola TaxID=3037259 RepID=UPI00286F5F53|nr:VOC family protein [Pseudovibrio sp. M1P-2-3]